MNQQNAIAILESLKEKGFHEGRIKGYKYQYVLSQGVIYATPHSLGVPVNATISYDDPVYVYGGDVVQASIENCKKLQEIYDATTVKTKFTREFRFQDLIFRNEDQSHTCNIIDAKTEEEVDMFSFGDFNRSETTYEEFISAVQAHILEMH